VDLSVIARGTPGFAGADLANLVNEAALVAARQNRKVVTMYDFEVAKDKVMMGAERKSMIISDEEKRGTAYHEAGHALVAALIPNADPVHKVSIIPRGMALGSPCNSLSRTSTPTVGNTWKRSFPTSWRAASPKRSSWIR
jgi:cell division protease FtsH